jgi:hypothetical protein
MSLEDAPCDHKGSLEFVETSLMGDMTMETAVLCKKCKKQIIIKGGIFTPITRGPQNEPR